MTRIPMTAAKPMRYGTRRLRAGDTFDAARQDARVLTAVGLARETRTPAPASSRKPTPRPAQVSIFLDEVHEASGELDGLRAEYETRTGRKADRRWGAARIKSEMIEA